MLAIRNRLSLLSASVARRRKRERRKNGQRDLRTPEICDISSKLRAGRIPSVSALISSFFLRGRTAGLRFGQKTVRKFKQCPSKVFRKSDSPDSFRHRKNKARRRSRDGGALPSARTPMARTKFQCDRAASPIRAETGRGVSAPEKTAAGTDRQRGSNPPSSSCKCRKHCPAVAKSRRKRW